MLLGKLHVLDGQRFPLLICLVVLTCYHDVLRQFPEFMVAHTWHLLEELNGLGIRSVHVGCSLIIALVI